MWEEQLRFGKFLGIKDFEGAKRNKYFIGSSLMTCEVLLIVWFTFFSYLPDYTTAIRTLLIMPFLCSGLMKAVSMFFEDGVLAYDAQAKIIDKFFETSETNPKFRVILMRDLTYIKKGGYIFFGLVFIAHNLAVASTWIMSLYLHEYYYMVPIYIPFTNPQMLFGFLLNQCLIFWLSTMAFLTITMSGYGHFKLFVFAITMTDIYILKLRDFGSELEGLKLLNDENMISQKEFEENLKILEETFIDLIEEYQTYSEYVNRLQKLMAGYNFVVILMNSMALALGIFTAFTYSVLIGVSFSIGYLSEVAFACVEGAIITRQNEKLQKELCGFPWYEMSPKMRKTFLQFIHCCQNAPEIKLPFFGVVNMEIFTNVINGSYSVFNFFLNFTNY